MYQICVYANLRLMKHRPTEGKEEEMLIPKKGNNAIIVTIKHFKSNFSWDFGAQRFRTNQKI